MMNYENFKEVVAEKFKEYLPEKYRGMKLSVLPVYKVNRVLDGIQIKKKEGTRNVALTIYINDMYEEYLKTDNLQAVLQGATKRIERAFEDMPEMAGLSFEDKFEDARDNIVFQVINTEQNKEMLSRMPHREYLDLSIIYRWVIAVGENGTQSTIIKNELAEAFGMNEEQLFQCAVENTRKMFPPVVRSMKDEFRRDGAPEEMIEEMSDEMYIISNDRGANGAVSILYEDNLHKLAEKLETDLYILPSSVHECLAVSVEMRDPYELAEVVHEINMSEVDLRDRLSNQIYHYDKDTRKLSVATDTLNKSLE